MIETWVFLLGIFATALICFGGGFALGLLHGLKELQKDIEEKAITIKHSDTEFARLDYILEIIDRNRDTVLHSNSQYTPNDVLYIIDEVCSEIEELRSDKK